MKTLKTKFVLILFLLIGGIAILSAKNYNVANLTGSPRTISEYLFGYNAKISNKYDYNDENFQNLLKSMDVGNYRYPGGTYGNYFDWRTGKGMRPQDQHKTPYTIKDFVNAIPSDETTITYMVNMARPTPATEIYFEANDEILASDEVFFLKKKDILEALEEFQKHGHLPEYLELGNEFYFENEHASIYAANPVLYIKHAKHLAKTIKNLYPNIKIALIAGKSNRPSQRAWNEVVYRVLNNDSTLRSLISAITQHHYAGGIGEFILEDSSAVKQVISDGISYSKNLYRKNDYKNVPNGLEIWLTEYGAILEGTHNTWASGLRALGMTFGFMEATSNITSFNFHRLGSEETITSENYTLSNNGIIFKLLMSAAKGKNKAQKIKFNNNPFFFKEDESLIGWKFWKDEKQSVIIMNASDSSFNNYQIDSLFNGSNDFKIIQSFSQTPWISGDPISNNNVTTIEKTTPFNIIKIPEFSVTLIENI